MTTDHEGLNQEAFLLPNDPEQELVLPNVDAQSLSDEQLWERKQQRCTRCQQIKPLDATQYAPAPRYARKFRRRCRACDNDLAKQWNKDNEQRVVENRRAWVQAHPEQNRAYQHRRYTQMSAALQYVREHHIPLDDNEIKADADE